MTPRIPLAPVPPGVLPFKDLASRMATWAILAWVFGGGAVAIVASFVEWVRQ